MEFNLPLTVDILHWLSGYRLTERLGFAVRLWVLLHKLYGHNDEQFKDLPTVFRYTDIRDRLLSESHPKNDPTAEQPIICPDRECICHLPLSHWLDEISDELQRALKFSDEIWQQKLQEHPFEHSHRTLRKALPYLVNNRWLKSGGNAHQFSRVRIEDLPQLTQHVTQHVGSHLDILHDISFIDPRLYEILSDLEVDYYQKKRLFIHLDFILSPDAQERVDDLQIQLNELWASAEISPVRFYYNTRFSGIQVLITYPVCLFYARRAKYLSAYGQTPDGAIGWYNFRLDRITSEKLEILPWIDERIPPELIRLKSKHRLPTPEDVETKWQEAWGTDFYLPKVLMILRFPKDFAQRYIEGTERHPTFKSVSYPAILNLLRNHPDWRTIQHILEQRSPDDAYYSAQVRLGDTNLIMRLRDWRPNGEVIAPLELREQMRQEAAKELSFYQDLGANP